MIQPEEIVRSGPNQFISQKGIYHEIESFVTPFQSPAIVTGYDSYQAFSQYTKLPSEWPVVQHKGYSSPNAITRIAEELKSSDVIIGIGGGTILDTAKSVADALQIEVIMVPTIPGTCAASTPLSVIYDDKGNFMRVDYHKRSSYLTLIDHTFLLSSPLSYLQSGIGDTLAKWYEAEAIIRNTKGTLPLMVHAALKQAVYVRDILLTHSEEAVSSLKTGQLSQAGLNIRANKKHRHPACAFFLLKIEVIWVWTRALIFIELINDTHFMGGQLEIKYVCIFDDSALRHRFRNGDNAMLQIPAKNDLRH